MLKDHEGLHDAVGRSALAGGAAAVAGMFLPAPVAAGLLALAVGVAVAFPRGRASAAWAILWACAAGAAMQIGGTVGLAGAAIAVGGSIARGVRGNRRRLLAGSVGALGAATAGMIARAFDSTGVLGFLPTGLEALAVGATSGLVVGVSSLGRHVHRLEPSIEGELHALAGNDEIGQLLGRAAVAYREAVEALGGDAPGARQAADDLVRRMALFGRRWQEVEAQAGRARADELRARASALAARTEATQDTVARVEFERAREAVTAQLQHLEEIERGRERAVARLTHQVATLERLRLAAVRHRSADATRLGLELQPLVEELAEAGGDLDVAAEALTEAATSAALPSTTVN